MKLQTETINQLADRIEQCEEVNMGAHQPLMGLAFSMEYNRYKCGAPACLLGHQSAMYGRTKKEINNYTYIAFANELGITSREAVELYVPCNGFAYVIARPGEPGWITKHHAVAVLRHLANTGEVDWSIGKGKI